MRQNLIYWIYNYYSMIKVSDELKMQVEREYQQGFNHVQTWRDEVREQMEASLNDKAPE